MFGLSLFGPKRDYTDLVQDIKAKSAQLVDIREKSEWQQGRFQCAVNIPLSEIQSGTGIKKLKRYDKVLLHCRSGSRVHMAKRILTERGLNNFDIFELNISQMVALGLNYA
ncbi:MAG: rhodanese-like domain-containing protein [Deltaproteobacteria bacterium]|nr:rhodanese-like domain-containing protein [Deltaproteobacteria bacterium]